MSSKTIKIGITGGIGSGKTEVARILTELGETIIDADLIGKKVVEDNKNIMDKIVGTFGDSILDPNGNLNRKKLGSMVFEDETKREQSNRIVHPELLRQLQDQLNESNTPLVFVDAALIYEAEMDQYLDGVIVVKAELESRVQWIQKRDWLSRNEVMNRVHSQMPIEEKLARADWIIENDGDLEELKSKVTALLPQIKKEN